MEGSRPCRGPGRAGAVLVGRGDGVRSGLWVRFMDSRRLCVRWWEKLTPFGTGHLEMGRRQRRAPSPADATPEKSGPGCALVPSHLRVSRTGLFRSSLSLAPAHPLKRGQ